MHGQEQHRLVRRTLDQHRAIRRFGRQVERPYRFRVDNRGKCCLPVSAACAPSMPQADGAASEQVLTGRAVFGRGEIAAQQGVAPGERGQGTLQSIPVQRAA